MARSNETVKLRLMETYCWLISPYIDLEGDSHTICWEEENIRGGSDTPITKVRKKLEANDALISHWAPALLLMKLGLNFSVFDHQKQTKPSVRYE